MCFEPVAPRGPSNNSKWAVKVAIEPPTLRLGWSGLITNYSSSKAVAPGPNPSVICVSALAHLSVRLFSFLARRSRAVISGQRQPVIKPVISPACQLTPRFEQLPHLTSKLLRFPSHSAWWVSTRVKTVEVPGSFYVVGGTIRLFRMNVR